MCREVLVTGSSYGSCLGVYTLKTDLTAFRRPVYENAAIGRHISYFSHAWVSLTSYADLIS